MSRSILRAPSFESEDARDFLAEARARPLFAPSKDLTIARAPGRLDLMGGIADYSGSLVLQWPLQEATLAAVQLADDGELRATSLAGGSTADRTCSMPFDALFPGGKPIPYDEARSRFRELGASAWTAYVFGALLVLAREKSVTPPRGLRVLIRSQVPEGKGVSSSAALEVATLQALSASLGISIEGRELALLAQIVENRVVGAACGVMDQMTASCGVSGELLALLCQPAELQGTLTLPEDLEIWGLDSGVRHAVSGSDYTSVRVAAFMGARILAENAGLRVEPSGQPGHVRIDDPRWKGYLANVTPAELSSGAVGSLPETLGGSDFLARYGGIADTVTSVLDDREYSIRACASHPIHEHFRVRSFAALLGEPQSRSSSERLGELMYQSHESYSSCGLGSEATDRLVSLVKAQGPDKGFFGAKITGGGSGGTVAVLGRRGADIGNIVDAFASRTGYRPQVFKGSSSGSAAFGAIRLGPDH